MRSNSAPSAWRAYFYPGTEVLRNKENIRDAARLADREHIITAKRQIEVTANLHEILGDTVADRMKSVHHILFSDLYDWAGQYRDVNIEKGGHSFGDHSSMGMYMRQAQRKIEAFDWNASTFDDKLRHLAEIHTGLNFAHPFREGNGRTTKMFMADLAQQHGIDLDLTDIDPDTWNEASRKTFLDRDGLRQDPGPLIEVYRNISSPLVIDPEPVPRSPAE